MRVPWCFSLLSTLVAFTSASLWGGCRNSLPHSAVVTSVGRPPHIHPDYTDLVIPPNIAPLNFTIREPGTRYYVRLSGEHGGVVEVANDAPTIRIPLKPWRRLVRANVGGTIRIEINVQDDNGAWTGFTPVVNQIATEPIDPYLVYRQIDPAYNYWGHISIHQRALESFDERPIVQNKQFTRGCVNCHAFRSNSPDHMTLGIRSTVHGAATILITDHHAQKLGVKFGYTAWHPSGKVVCYSANKVHQFFHWARPEVRDVVDLDSELAYFDLRTWTAKSNRGIADPHRLETYPTWTPDGKWLYFCSAAFMWENRQKIPPVNYDKCRYDLRRIRYDVEADRWGQPETVLSSSETGKSIMLPRISPDGRWLVFCMCDYGCFPIYQPSSDLYVMDLSNGQYRRLAINSDRSESWHSWSSNGRWLVFSSKRRDGLLTRPYFSYVDDSGQFHKPFLLPQEDPGFYDAFIKTHSLPEFLQDPLNIRSRVIAETVTAASSVKIADPVSFGPAKPNEPQGYHDLPSPWKPASGPMR
ncbi:MAG: TolB family protein [Candidatus Zipacnadales bacterium]